MKYIFTKEWYNEMQVSGSLVFPESKEDWEEQIAFYKSEGMDYEELAKTNLEYIKEDLLKFLPEKIHPYIHDETLKSQFPSPELRKMVEEWQSEYLERSRIKANEYRKYYESITDILPKNAVLLMEEYLHDANILSFDKPGNDQFVMILDRGYGDSGQIQLTFLGVKTLDLSEIEIGSSWIYSEIYAEDEGYELHVLFDSPLGEMTIRAADVQIRELSTNEGDLLNEAYPF
ncbi:DUF4085 family protein [Saccharibacillus kuerlensis]|uniref:DUF4085 family protein n=1 Tax=Saccharibacillus kuerlensis TaxID=459527 RepID=A0ABQ2KTY2_9BACL|nr:DUF4085 family protein [Saccharibacillus kuerlensis]GGN91427.1 hypothetical protein GCM10010969_03090 [Saccharibacillus kuerlensis]